MKKKKTYCEAFQNLTNFSFSAFSVNLWKTIYGRNLHEFIMGQHPGVRSRSYFTQITHLTQMMTKTEVKQATVQRPYLSPWPTLV